MQTKTLSYPQKIVFGTSCFDRFVQDYLSLGYKRLMIITIPPVAELIEKQIELLKQNMDILIVVDNILKEPTFSDLKLTRELANTNKVDSVVGIGGGSVLDLAKIVAALCNRNQNVFDTVGIGNLEGRDTYLACIPTTAGTGSEVSPNSILLDESDHQKKGIISPWLIADCVYIDPLLMLSVPSHVTAYTGIDALSHSLEAFINVNAHPMVDLYALEGIKNIACNLKAAVDNGQDVEARTKLALGSMYGGMCLGPVNTAAVHALAYPLGGEFHIPHGLSIAVMMPYVIEFNLEAAPERYAKVALALGANKMSTDIETASAGVEFFKSLLSDCSIPTKLSELGITEKDIPGMVSSAMGVTRLLKNNPVSIGTKEATHIYYKAL